MLTPAEYESTGYPGLGCCEERLRLLADKLRLTREVASLTRLYGLLKLQVELIYSEKDDITKDN